MVRESGVGGFVIWGTFSLEALFDLGVAFKIKVIFIKIDREHIFEGPGNTFSRSIPNF